MALTRTRDEEDLVATSGPRRPAPTSLRSISAISTVSTALLAPRGPDPYREWYLDTSDRGWSDPAKEAFETAIANLTQELTLEERKSVWLRGRTSMRDVQDAILAAEREYRDKAKGSKVRTWLATCSSRVMYYSTIFDVFVQHHPEYVSLAWGTFKFLFVGVINHEELLTEISKSMARIADLLPRTELHSVLYPSRDMREAVSRVYASVLEFAVAAVKWYKKGKLAHSLAAVVKPFGLSFKSLVDELSERSRLVDKLASAAMKAELRDMHLVIRDMHAGQRGMNDEIRLLKEQVVGFSIANQTLHSQMLLGMQSQRQLFLTTQLSHIHDTFLLDEAPSSESSLAYCRSLRNRRRQKAPVQLPEAQLEKLQAWLADGSSSLLLAQGHGVRASSLNFAADFLDTVIDAGYPVIWALPSSVSDEEEKGPMARPSIVGILRSLVFQALNLNPGAMSEGVNPITSRHFKSATTVEQWFGLLERCISPLPRVFLVVHIGLLETAASHDEAASDEGGDVEGGGGDRVGDFIERLAHMVRRRSMGGLKIVIASWQFAAKTSLDTEELFGEDRQIVTDGGRRQERLMRKPKFRLMFRQRNQKFMAKFRTSVHGILASSVA